MANHEFETKLELDKTYQFSLDNTTLYHAKFIEIKGCWGTVQITHVSDSSDAKYYKIGDTFEIKIAMYGIKPV